MKKIINVLILVSFYLFIYLLFKGIIPGECLFKRIFGINCPACGLTRSIKAILRLDFISSFNYNILGIPLFIVIIFMTISLIADIIKDTDKTINYMLKYLGKYYYVIFIVLIVSMVINNIRCI